ncbi:MAG: septum formation initiator family protein [Candidatus Adiutrix sp.]|nr:septum formation initiator family protein [Candidatus Adiutrix sp.]
MVGQREFPGRPARSGPRAGAAAALGLILAAGGCLVDNEEYDQAQRQWTALRTELQKLRQGNDQLNQEIARLYGDCEVLSSHVAMTAASALHSRLAAGPAPRPVPVTVAAPAARPAAAARPARPSTRPAQTPTRPASTSTSASASGPNSAPPPPPPPPENPSGAGTGGLDLSSLPPAGSGSGGRPGGAVDWGQ